MAKEENESRSLLAVVSTDGPGHGEFARKRKLAAAKGLLYRPKGQSPATKTDPKRGRSASKYGGIWWVAGSSGGLEMEDAKTE